MEENKMGVQPINKLLLTISLPLMLSMLVQASYNIIDSMFVSRLSQDALNAVSAAYPIQHLMAGVATGTGVGVNALLSRYLGKEDHKKVKSIAGNAILLIVFSYALFMIFGIFFARIFFEKQSASPEFVNLGARYLSIVCLMSFGMFTQIIFERMLQATGRTIYTMFTQISGAVINIILDPILIFGYFGVPAMGITGAAVATVIGQICAGILAIIFNQRSNKEVKIKSRDIRLNLGTIKEIYGIGIPTMIMQSIGSITTYFLNRIFGNYTTTAIGVYGVFYKLQTFISLPIFGLGGGVIPIMAYNYGKENKERVKETFRYSLIFSIVVAFIGCLIFQTMPKLLLGLFNASEEMLEVGIPAFRIMSISYVVAGLSMSVSSVFQALGKSTYSMMTSIARQVVVLIPAAYLISTYWDISNIWWAFPIADIMSFVLCIVFIIIVYKNIINHIGENPKVE